jgi:hypothetical protein
MSGITFIRYVHSQNIKKPKLDIYIFLFLTRVVCTKLDIYIFLFLTRIMCTKLDIYILLFLTHVVCTIDI